MPSRFAHLLGLGRPAAGKPSAEEDDDDKEKKGKGTRAEGEEGEDKDKDEDKPNKDASEEDGNEDDDKPKKGKKARADDDDDDADMSEEDEDEDDKKDKGDAKALAARTRERARCAAIFASKHAAARPDMAAHLAFETRLGRNAACAMLRTAAMGSGAPQSGLSGRMAGMEQMRTGAGAPAGKPNVASSWDAAAKRTGLTSK